MMWENWIFWILVGGLTLFLFRRGGFCGHAGNGGTRNDGMHHGDLGPGTREEAGKATKPAGGGCH